MCMRMWVLTRMRVRHIRFLAINHCAIFASSLLVLIYKLTTETVDRYNVLSSAKRIILVFEI